MNTPVNATPQTVRPKFANGPGRPRLGRWARSPPRWTRPSPWTVRAGRPPRTGASSVAPPADDRAGRAERTPGS